MLSQSSSCSSEKKKTLIWEILYIRFVAGFHGHVVVFPGCWPKIRDQIYIYFPKQNTFLLFVIKIIKTDKTSNFLNGLPSEVICCDDICRKMGRNGSCKHLILDSTCMKRFVHFVCSANPNNWTACHHTNFPCDPF